MHMRTSRVVPGRKDILILQPYFLEEHDGSHYLPKACRLRLFIVGALCAFHRSCAI